MNALEMASRLRSLTGFEEEWLAHQAAPAPAVPVCHSLLARCLEPVGGDGASALEQVRGLRLDERDWLLMELRRASFGAALRAEALCPACGETNELEAPAAAVAPPPAAVGPRGLELSGGRRAVLRPLTAGDHECFQREVHAGSAARASAALSRVLTEAPVEPWSLIDRARMMEALAALTPGPVLLKLECCKCRCEVTAHLDLCAFIASEVRQHARTLIDDVHVLASAYHWSEREILGLPLRRRLAYLMKIEAAHDAALWRGKAI